MDGLNFLDKGLSALVSKPKRKTDPFYGKAKRLSDKLGIPITIEPNSEYGNGYWLETDLIDDGRFASSWEELYGALKALEELPK
tara:strand:- start:1325 stop:1576 length:252 start_codon:yes stop_codon:yes gene_type:complete